MISFRFHLVSLAAVFLALALGIVLGVAALDQATVSVLENRIKSVRTAAADARDDLHVWERFGDHAEAALVAGRLDGVRVFTVVPEGLPSGIGDRFRTLLATAGAIDAGTLILDDAWADEAVTASSDISSALGIVGPINREAAVAEAAARLARDFAAGGGPTLPALVGANLMRLSAGDPAAAPGLEARIVVVDDGAPTGLLEPFARAVGVSMPAKVLVADGSPDDEIRESLVVALRNDPGDARLSTVDHLQTLHGRVAAVFALRDFERGVVGDYGSGPRADRAVPASGG